MFVKQTFHSKSISGLVTRLKKAYIVESLCADENVLRRVNDGCEIVGCSNEDLN